MKQILQMATGALAVALLVMFFLISGFFIGRVFSAIECRDYGETKVAGLHVICAVPSKEKEVVFV